MAWKLRCVEFTPVLFTYSCNFFTWPQFFIFYFFISPQETHHCLSMILFCRFHCGEWRVLWRVHIARPDPVPSSIKTTLHKPQRLLIKKNTWICCRNHAPYKTVLCRLVMCRRYVVKMRRGRVRKYKTREGAPTTSRKVGLPAKGMHIPSGMQEVRKGLGAHD